MLCRLYGSVVQMLPACLCCHECCNAVLMQNYMSACLDAMPCVVDANTCPPMPCVSAMRAHAHSCHDAVSCMRASITSAVHALLAS